MFIHSFKTICLLVSFANNLDPDKARQIVGPDLGSNCLTLCDGIRGRKFLKSLILQQKQQNQRTQNHKNT